MLESITAIALKLAPLGLAALTVALTVAGPWLAALVADLLKAKLSVAHREVLKDVLVFVYDKTEMWAEGTENKADDKLRHALGLLADQLGRKPTKAERTAAAAYFAGLAVARKAA